MSMAGLRFVPQREQSLVRAGLAPALLVFACLALGQTVIDR
jgi:hypothetical protein